MLRLVRSLKISSFEQFCLLLTAFLIPWQNVQVVRKGITVFHVVNLFLLAVLLCVYVRKHAIRWHFAFPVWIYLIGSLLGMYNSRVLGLNLYTLGQDLYLYLWFTVLCVILSSERNIECLVSAWLFSAVIVLSTDNLFGTGTARPEFTFRNPNRAAAYMIMSSVLLLHPVVPRLLRFAVIGALLVGVKATGSTAGFLALMIGVPAVLWSWSRVRAPRAAWLVGWSGAVALVLIAVLASDSISRSAAIDMLENVAPEGSAPRIERSSSVRGEIWALGLNSFSEHPLGIGPASFYGQIESLIGRKNGIELHSDVMSSLVERGAVGFIGFVGFNLAIVGMLLRTLQLAAASGNGQQQYWAAVLAGGLLAYQSFMLTHEVLHHETFWLLLALATVHRSSLERSWRTEVRVQQKATMQLAIRSRWSSAGGRRILPVVAWRTWTR